VEGGPIDGPDPGPVVRRNLDADDFTLPTVSGVSIEALIAYVDTGSAATSRLVGYWDTGVTGLPLTPNGGDVNVTINASGLLVA
jgi:hypothetical protein